MGYGYDKVEVRVKLGVKGMVRIVCKIYFLVRALGLKAATRPSARATMRYLVYKG